MSVSLEYLTSCSSQTGYQAVPLEKVVRLGELAGDMARHPFLGSALALKGGTALNLCFGPPRRLSVDLDYNYVGQIERAKMLENRPLVEKAAAEIAKRQGYRVQRSADSFAGRKLYLSYRSVLAQEERIEVDLNFLFRMPLNGTEARELWQPGELDRPMVPVVSMEEILVGKILALLDRGAARDVWDVANLPSAAVNVLGSRLFRAWLIALAAILDHPLASYTRARIEARITDRVVTEQLAPILTAAVTLPSRELVGRAWAVVDRFLSLTSNEEEFISAIQEGELRPEMLIPDDPKEVERIAGHPAIQWKIANVRTYLAKSAKTRKGAKSSPRPT